MILFVKICSLRSSPLESDCTARQFDDNCADKLARSLKVVTLTELAKRFSLVVDVELYRPFYTCLKDRTNVHFFCLIGL